MKRVFVVTAYHNEDSLAQYLVGVYDNFLTSYIEAVEEEKQNKYYTCEILSIPLNERITDNATVVKALVNEFNPVFI